MKKELTPLRRLRKNKDLTLCEVAEMTGLSQPYLSELENGNKNNPSLSTLQKLAKAYKVKTTTMIKLLKLDR